MGKEMGIKKTFLATVVGLLLLSPNSLASNEDAYCYKKGLEKGIEVGIRFERERLKQDFLSFRDLMKSVFDYKYYFLKGEIPPPLVVNKFEVIKGKNGIARIERKIEVLPPAYFPISLFQSLRGYGEGKIVKIPKGYWVYVDTKDLPLSEIALYSYVAETKGYSPVYVASSDKLIFAVKEREADAKESKDELAKIGIKNIKIAEVNKPYELRIQVSDDMVSLREDFLNLARQIIDKERKVAGVGVNRKVTVNDVIKYLQKALAVAQALNPKKYEELNIPLLEKDIEEIINNLSLAISEARGYDAVFVRTAKEGNAIKLKKAEGYEDKEKEDIEKLLEKVKKLKRSVGK